MPTFPFTLNILGCTVVVTGFPVILGFNNNPRSYRYGGAIYGNFTVTATPPPQVVPGYPPGTFPFIIPYAGIAQAITGYVVNYNP